MDFDTLSQHEVDFQPTDHIVIGYQGCASSSLSLRWYETGLQPVEFGVLATCHGQALRLPYSRMQIYRKVVKLPVSAAEAFAWHELPGAFSKLVPPWENVTLIDSQGGIAVGAFTEVKLGLLGPISMRGLYRHVEYQEGKLFVDEQVKGPFFYWRHEHHFRDLPEGGCEMDDYIQFKAPPFTAWLVKRRLEKMFNFRHQVTLELMSDMKKS